MTLNQSRKLKYTEILNMVSIQVGTLYWIVESLCCPFEIVLNSVININEVINIMSVKNTKIPKTFILLFISASHHSII